MKKKSITELLKKLEASSTQYTENIIDLSNLLSKKMLKGGYVTLNGSCTGGFNSSCQNNSCVATTDISCWNFSCP